MGRIPIECGTPRHVGARKLPGYPSAIEEWDIPLSGVPPEGWRAWFGEVADHGGAGRPPRALQLFPPELRYQGVAVSVPADADAEPCFEYIRRRVAVADMMWLKNPPDAK